MSTAASQYLREVKKRIPCLGSQKTEFLCQLEAEVIYYCEDHDDVDITMLFEHFGKPEDISQEFLSELSADAVLKSNSSIRRFMFFGITITIVLLIGVGIHAYYTQQKLLDGQYIETITYEGSAPKEPVVWVLTDSDGEDVYWEFSEDDNLWIEETNRD